MGDEITILSLGDRRRWEEVEACGVTPSQCWRYSAALVHSGMQPNLAIVEADGSRLLLPFVERCWNGQTDIATIPGLSGASIVPGSAAPLAQWHAFAATQGWVAGYIQLAADSYPNVPGEVGAVERAQMFFLDVRQWSLRETASLIVRRKVAAALRAGAAVSDDRAALVAALQPLYLETLSRFGGVSPIARATIDEWSSDHRNLLLGVMLNGTVEAVHLVQVHGDAAELHLVGTTERGRALSALLHTAVIERLQATGVARLNLGGAQAVSGLGRFKRWLGGAPRPLQSIGQIYDRARYEALCRDAGVAKDEPWFPAYRAEVRHQRIT
jgi:hypothetical protein